MALNDYKEHVVPNGSDDVRCLMMIDYVQLFVFVLYWLRMKLHGFANHYFVEQYLVPYEYAGISLVIIEAFKWLL